MTPSHGRSKEQIQEAEATIRSVIEKIFLSYLGLPSTWRTRDALCEEVWKALTDLKLRGVIPEDLPTEPWILTSFDDQSITVELPLGLRRWLTT